MQTGCVACSDVGATWRPPEERAKVWGGVGGRAAAHWTRCCAQVDALDCPARTSSSSLWRWPRGRERRCCAAFGFVGSRLLVGAAFGFVVVVPWRSLVGCPRRAMTTPLAETSCAMRDDDWPESPIIVIFARANNVYVKRGISPRGMSTMSFDHHSLESRASCAPCACGAPRPPSQSLRARARSRPADCAPTPTARRLLLLGLPNRRCPAGEISAGGETARGRLAASTHS